jgi:hypothetical protein
MLSSNNKNYTKILSSLDDMNYISLQTIDNANSKCLTNPRPVCNPYNNNNYNNINTQINNLNATLNAELSVIPLNSIQMQKGNYEREQTGGLINIYYYLFLLYYGLVLIYLLGIFYITLFLKKEGVRGFRSYLVMIVAFLGYPFYIAFIERVLYAAIKFIVSMATSSVYLP